jgi:hypothetical protein
MKRYKWTPEIQYIELELNKIEDEISKLELSNTKRLKELIKKKELLEFRLKDI